MNSEWCQVSNESEIASPALLIFSERVDANLQLMLKIAGGPARLRPHVKTHKLGPLVARQVALGITKFKTSTIAETEMCAIENAPDVLLAFPPVGPNILRFCELVQRFPKTKFSVIADSAPTIRGLGVAARDAGVTVNVFLDLDCGMGRTGIKPGGEAFELYKLIASSAGLHAAGLHAYDGHIHEPDVDSRRKQCEDAFGPVMKFRAELEAAGLAVPLLVAGGSPTFPFHAACEDRECSPGTTVLWDFGYGDKFADMPFLPAAVLLTRVVSKSDNRLCLDLGHKAVAAENPQPRVRLLELPDATPIMHSEEHLVVETSHAGKFSVGQTLHGIPRHVCPSVALYSEAVLVEGGHASSVWPILARARKISV